MHPETPRKKKLRINPDQSLNPIHQAFPELVAELRVVRHLRPTTDAVRR